MKWPVIGVLIAVSFAGYRGLGGGTSEKELQLLREMNRSLENSTAVNEVYVKSIMN